ncbi:hypothetical protein ARMSODRAFT_982872 [Armillaria solidipes]|uniref:Uncharacterized protein n=1 Tax=Armillaria solidipes TaxID=1076256 RepID=A0A2H3B9F7_9AGAR|nr:hypothetical protein ARMSODRAFT_982872 [Armillaria solidipes]
MIPLPPNERDCTRFVGHPFRVPGSGRHIPVAGVLFEFSHLLEFNSAAAYDSSAVHTRKPQQLPPDVASQETAKPIPAVYACKNIMSPLIQLFFSLKILATNSYLSNVVRKRKTLGVSDVRLCDVSLATLCLLGPTCSPQKVTIDSALEDHPIETLYGRKERISNDRLFHSRKGVVGYFGVCDVVVPRLQIPCMSIPEHFFVAIWASHPAKTRKIFGQYASKERIKPVTCTANRDVVNDVDN